jgi:hypothetical protein
VAGLRFYFDEDSLDHDVVAAARLRGLDVMTALDAGTIGRPDEEQFAFALSEGRILYTANVADFARLHAALLAAAGTHPGIVVRARQQMPVGQQVRGLVALDARLSREQVRDQLLYLAEFLD